MQYSRVRFLLMKSENSRLLRPEQNCKGSVHKRCPYSGGRWFVQCRHFADKGVLQMRIFVIFGAKNFIIFEIYSVSVRTRGEGSWNSTGILRTRR